MGKGYGYQIRNFGGTGYDQLYTLLEGLKTDPNGRRHVITHWCPNQLKESALPPCHLLHLYSVKNNKLDSSFIMRSSDVYHGLPYNIHVLRFIKLYIRELFKSYSGTISLFRARRTRLRIAFKRNKRTITPNT